LGTTNAFYGLAIASGAALVSQGVPNAPNWCAQYNMVQEQPTNGWVRATNGLVLSEFLGASPRSTIYCRLTDFSVPSLDVPAFNAMTNIGPFTFQDCEFHGGQLLSAGPSFNLTNCLLERAIASLCPNDTLASAMQNCLVRGGALTNYPTNTTNCTISDSLFDSPLLANWSGYSGGYNAYVTCSLQPKQPGDTNLSASPAYQVGTLGNYYLLTNSGLANVGSTTANLVGLYHYTLVNVLQTNGYQIKETNSIVDIGYHYVATDASGNPICTPGDGIPDYLADTNGDGVYDAGDLCNWQAYTSPNALTNTTGLVVFTPLQ
jgi:hypothetical protein